MDKGSDDHSSGPLVFLVGRAVLEPATNGLKAAVAL